MFDFFGRRRELAELRQTVADAKAALTELREFASILTSAMLTELMAESFLDSMPLSTRLAIRDHLVASLEALGATREQIDRTLADWRKGIGIIYHRIIRAKIQEFQRFTTPESPEKQKIEWVNEFQNLLDFDKWRAPTPDEMQTFLQAHDALTPDLQEWIDDYRHFLKTDEIRRRDEFARG
jgi:hypothetical protein